MAKKMPRNPFKTPPKNKIPARAPLQSWWLHISADSLISWQELPLTQLQWREVAIYSQSASIYPQDGNCSPCPGSLPEEMPKALKYSQSRTDYLPLANCATMIVFHPQSSATPKLRSCWSSTANSQQTDHSSQTCGSTSEGSFKKIPTRPTRSSSVTYIADVQFLGWNYQRNSAAHNLGLESAACAAACRMEQPELGGGGSPHTVAKFPKITNK